MAIVIRKKFREEGLKFEWVWLAVKGPPYVAEFKPFTDRKFPFDFAWPEKKVALEIDGGIWMKDYIDPNGKSHRRGAHSTGKAMIRDREKDFLAAQIGWRVVRWTPCMVNVPNCEKLKEILAR